MGDKVQVNHLSLCGEEVMGMLRAGDQLLRICVNTYVWVCRT